MPQFDFTHVFWPQIAWLAVFFAILYFGIVGPTLPKLGKVIGEREGKVMGDIASAETAKAASDQLAADYEAGVATAQDEARGRLVKSRADAAASLEARLKDTNAALDARAQSAEAALAAARANAMAEIESVAADAAATIVEKLTGTRPVDTAAASAVRSALA